MPSLVDGNNKFATTAARIAYAWVNTDLGSVCYDSENGNYYLVIGVGAGVAFVRGIAGDDLRALVRGDVERVLDRHRRGGAILALLVQVSSDDVRHALERGKGHRPFRRSR